MLESTTIGVLGRVFGLGAGVTEDPGVWVGDASFFSEGESSCSVAGERQARQKWGGEERKGEGEGQGRLAKIAALGVHLRRHVTALGTALNVDMPGSVEDKDESVNPWARIVACGLEGKAVTSVRGELEGQGQGQGREELERRLEKAGYVRFLEAGRERMVAAAWADELAGRVGLEGVDVVGEEEVVRLVERLVREGGVGVDDVERDVEEERRYIARLREIYFD